MGAGVYRREIDKCNFLDLNENDDPTMATMFSLDPTLRGKSGRK